MILKKFISVISLITCLLLTSLTYGVKNTELINLTADHVSYDYKKGIVNYVGNVRADQGVTRLIADQMVIYYNPQHKIDKVVATGKLAQYTTLVGEKQILLKASAKTIKYWPLKERVLLEQQAKLEYNQSLFAGPYIFYDIKNKIISSHPKLSSQSKIILEPIKQLKSK